MAEVWRPRDRETLRHWLDTIIMEASDKLTDWERNFIDSIEGRLDFRRPLSQRQEEILERIYAEKTK